MFITPAVAGRLVIVGSCAGKLLALADSTGDVVWSYDTSVDGSPANFHGDVLVTEDLVVVGTDTDSIGHLYAFERPTGAVRWKHAFAGGVASQVLRDRDLALAVTQSMEIVAVDLATGVVRWRTPGPPDADADNLADPALAADRLFVGWRAGWLDAIDSQTGHILWRTSLLGLVNTSVLVVDGEVLVGTLDGFVHRVRASDGKLIESIDIGGMPFGDLVRAGDHVLVLVKSGETLHRLTAWTPSLDRLAWEVKAPVEWSSFRPAVHETAVLAGYPGRLLVLDATTGRKLSSCDVSGHPRGLAWLDDVIYVGLFEGHVLRIESPTQTPTKH